VLRDNGFKALVFVITDFVGKENTWDVQYGWRRFWHLDWETLGRWREAGVIDVHSHGASHRRLTWLADQDVAADLGRAREEVTRRLGIAPAGISYPYGAVDERVKRLALAAGHTLGFAGPSSGVAADAMLQPRLAVYAWDAGSLPFVLREDSLGAASRGVARFTNRCSVGTAFFQRILGRAYQAGNAHR
jgi:peptidoglycan/xylan/chitin deacetylase (PgdA/CDA1 family)